MLSCYRYDPETGKYTMAVMNLVRAAGALDGRRAGVAAVAGMAARVAQQARGASDRHGEARRWGSGLAGGFLRGLEMFAEVPLFPEQASTTAERVDALFFFLCAVTGTMAVSIAAAAAVLRRQAIAAAPRTNAPHASSAIIASNGSGPSRRCSSSSSCSCGGRASIRR